MGYVQKHLNAGESIVQLNTLHWIMFAWPVFWLLQAVMLGARVPNTDGVSITIFLLAAVSIVLRFMDLKGSEFAVTDSRIILKSGLIRRRSVEMNLAQVARVTVQQGVIGRILNFGTVVVEATSGSADSFSRISFPMQFKRAVQEQSKDVHVNEIGRHVAALQGEAASVPLAAVARPETDVVASLERLAKLKADGVLTEEEFLAQKAKLLA